MTTQHTHPEHSDVDASVVEHPSAPGDTVASTASEMAISEEAEAQTPASSTSSDLAAPVDVVETHHNPSVPPVEEYHPEPSNHHQDEDVLPIHQIIPETPPTAPEVVSTITAEPVPVSQTQEAPLVGSEEEVRPFTAFIEEFRQVEARINASVKESKEEVFSIFPPKEAEIAVPEQQALVLEVPTLSAQDQPSTEPVAEIVEAPEASTPSVQEEERQETEAIPTPTPPVERAVSPLLRPTSRLRPRHNTRHRGEHITESPEPSVEVTQPVKAVEAEQNQPAQPETTTPVEAESPRPARRYRFDRPAASNGATAPAAMPSPIAQPRIEESREKVLPPVRVENGYDASTQAVETKQLATNAVSTQETPAAKQPPVLPEAPTVESVPPAPVEHSRRRGHTKEQPAATNQTPVPEAITPVVEVTLQPEEIAPEDLPPLEYSELQKASSRRRRRHRSGASNNSTPVVATTPPVIAPLPVPAPPPPPVIAPPMSTPRTPDTTSAYSIVSGYTVNQMNQGNDITGPFMGPEPSPARGSVFSRDGRTTRAEAQRISAPSSYPGRSAESSPSSASLNQLTNGITQAIQTQTDRMVTELRRALQAPTNVTVSLPPFPSTERVGVFVDVANLLYSARTLRVTVDFGKLLDFLRGNRRLVRAHAYCPTSPQPSDEQMFLQAVKGLGYRITTKNYKTFSSGAKKADLDLDLCMDVVRIVEGKGVDCIVLVSGDSDFMPMLDYCSDHGVRVEVAAFDEAMSATLRQSCDLFVNLSMLEEIRADMR